MHGARDQFLAGAALAPDQHRHRRRRKLLHHTAGTHHAGISRQHSRQGHGLALQLQLAILLFQIRQAERPVDDVAQQIHVQWLLTEVVGTRGHGIQCVVAIGVARDHDHLGMWRQRKHLTQCREPFGYA